MIARSPRGGGNHILSIPVKSRSSGSGAGTISIMANYSTSEFRGGLKVLMDGDPCVIVENEFVKPGKGQAFNRVRIRTVS